MSKILEFAQSTTRSAVERKQSSSAHQTAIEQKQRQARHNSLKRKFDLSIELLIQTAARRGEWYVDLGSDYMNISDHVRQWAERENFQFKCHAYRSMDPDHPGPEVDQWITIRWGEYE